MLRRANLRQTVQWHPEGDQGKIAEDGYRNKLQIPWSEGLSDGAMVLGKLPVPGRPTNLDE